MRTPPEKDGNPLLWLFIPDDDFKTFPHLFLFPTRQTFSQVIHLPPPTHPPGLTNSPPLP